MIIETVVENIDRDLGFAGKRHGTINFNSGFVETLLDGDTKGFSILNCHDGAG